MKRMLVALSALVVLAGGALGASHDGTTATATDMTATIGMHEIAFQWQASAAGKASGTTTDPYLGEVAAVYTVYLPGASAPTTAYDLSIVDGRGVDVLLGSCNESKVGYFDSVQGWDGYGAGSGTGRGVVTGSQLTVIVTDAGAHTGGTTFLWIRER